MRSTFKILFYINRQKIKKNGKCPIMGRITLDGKIVQYSTKEEIEPIYWNPKEGCCTGKGNDSKSINIRLGELKKDIERNYRKEHPLTFHQGRHSWATTICLSNGVPIETVSRTMGHRSIKTTQIYAEVTNMKMDEDMKLLESRIGNKYQFPNADNKIDELLEFERNNSEFVKLKQEERV